MAAAPSAADWLRGLPFVQACPSLLISGEGWGLMMQPTWPVSSEGQSVGGFYKKTEKMVPDAMSSPRFFLWFSVL